MPNMLAYLVLFAWPLVVMALFTRLPPARAAIWAVLAGYMVLPVKVAVDLPLLPAINKSLVPVLAAVVLCALLGSRGRGITGGGNTARGWLPRSWSGWLLVMVFVLSPAVTTMANMDAAYNGARLMPGLRNYDIFSFTLFNMVMVLPLLLGRRMLGSAEDHAYLLRALAIAGLIYTVPMLIEIRLSPQLNTWIYGFFPHSFGQQVRDGAYRPVVFLGHGLLVAIFTAMALLAAAVSLRIKAGWMRFGTVWLLGLLVLCKSFGALAMAALLLPFALLARPRLMLTVATIAALICLTYPMLRKADMVPKQAILEWVASYEQERANSLEHRFTNEDMLLAHADRRPYLGWGGWGRGRVFDEETGEDTSTVDGTWIGQFATYGWVGYLATFGLLTWPVLLIAWRRRRLDIGLPTAGLCLVLSLNLLDLLPNSSLSPLTWLMAGALLGFVERAGARRQTAQVLRRADRTPPVESARPGG